MKDIKQTIKVKEQRHTIKKEKKMERKKRNVSKHNIGKV
jgi:hypothetical protein